MALIRIVAFEESNDQSKPVSSARIVLLGPHHLLYKIMSKEVCSATWTNNDQRKKPGLPPPCITQASRSPRLNCPRQRKSISCYIAYASYFSDDCCNILINDHVPTCEGNCFSGTSSNSSEIKTATSPAAPFARCTGDANRQHGLE
ncbi:hypothetical protein LTR86_006539 [Recurvomyces mirabilis]|nr:hypothetical protein LTR86_006539 [Recurvomyces mirabilis]